MRQCFEQHRAISLTEPHLSELHALQAEAQQHFLQTQPYCLQSKKTTSSSIEHLLQRNYGLQLTPCTYDSLDSVFHCSIENRNTAMFVLLNGWYLYRHSALTIFPDGVVAGSLRAALKQFPEWVLPHLKETEYVLNNDMVTLNKALFYDGFFIYVPDNVIADSPLQMVNLVRTTNPLLIPNRDIVILGKNASLKMAHCHDTIQHGKTLIDDVTHIHLGDGASLHYYKIENKEHDSLLFDHVFVEQGAGSRLYSGTLTFNAGHAQNYLSTNLRGPHAEARLNGLYLVDKKQQIQNHVFVNHIAPDCKSHQLYKGIADEEATASFHGHILVNEHATRTEAYQSSKNITLTNTAHVTTQPFLEIYTDDVQCSHGATIGQLNDDALFYLRSRGICEYHARMLLMHAFTKEITDTIDIHSLRDAMTELVEKRLRGELQSCQNCILCCNDKKELPWQMDIKI
ncbi:MAG: Fe-S cluster assembly protein SufD [Bacteroidales bacterium]|nr:Fe-S cluster assembly protein SufD [Bacteroidales bacterium]